MFFLQLSGSRRSQIFEEGSCLNILAHKEFE